MNEDYAYLFKNPWCPLFGDLGDIAQIDDLEERFQVGRCLDIIDQAREIWGMTPHDMTFTSWPKERDIPVYQTNFSSFVNEDPGGFYKYPFWKVEEARKITVIWVHLPQHLASRNETISDIPQDIEWEKTLDIIKDWDTPEINVKITDSEILAVIAIKNAWYALEDIFYYGENEDSPGVLKKVQVASGLLTKAQQLETEKIKKDKDQTLQNKEADTEKKDIMIEALLQKALIEKKDKVQETSNGLMSVPVGTKWPDIEIGIDCYNEKICIGAKNKKIRFGFLKFGLKDGRSSKGQKTPRMTDLLIALIKYADAEGNIIYTGKMRLKEYEKLSTDTKRLNKLIRQKINGIDGPPIVYIKNGGFKSQFGKLYLISTDYDKPTEITTSELFDVPDPNY